MSKAKANLIKVNLKADNASLAVYLALQCNDEGDGQVYLDNAYDMVASCLSRSQFAGYLSSLQAEGKYQTQGDSFFGKVIYK